MSETQTEFVAGTVEWCAECRELSDPQGIVCTCHGKLVVEIVSRALLDEALGAMEHVDHPTTNLAAERIRSQLEGA